MKTLVLIFLITSFVQVSLAQENKPCKDPDTGESKPSGTVISRNGKRYQCRNGTWKKVPEEEPPTSSDRKPPTSPLVNFW